MQGRLLQVGTRVRSQRIAGRVDGGGVGSGTDVEKVKGVAIGSAMSIWITRRRRK